MDLIAKIEEMSSDRINTRFASTRHDTSAEESVKNSFVYFDKITYEENKKFITGRSTIANEEEVETAALKYKMLNCDSKLVRKILECKDELYV